MTTSNQRLICLIASHITTEKRREYFDELTQCIFAQQVPPDRLLLSISKAEAVDWPQSLPLLEERYEVHKQPRLMKQFEHYDYLAGKLRNEDPQNTWVIFSDDDDLWAPHRVAWYKEKTEEAQLYPKDDRTVGHFRSNYWKTGDSLETAIVRRYQDEKDGKWIAEGKQNEYVHLCVRLAHFMRFMEVCPNVVKSDRFCDVLFYGYITTLTRRRYFWLEINGDEDMAYFYRTNAQNSVLTELETKRINTINKGDPLKADITAITETLEQALARCCGHDYNGSICVLFNWYKENKTPMRLFQFCWNRVKTTSIYRRDNIQKLWEASTE